MQVDSATLNPALPATRVAEVTRAPVAPEPVVKPDLEPNVVDISPIARARSALVRAGDAGNVDFAGPVKAVVGEGDPNAELRARVRQMAQADGAWRGLGGLGFTNMRHEARAQHLDPDNAGSVFLRTPEGADLELDLGGGFHHSPQLAAADGTVALLVLEVESGIYNRLRLVRLSASGVVAELPVSASGVPSVYEASLTLVDGQHAVVAWQEGDNPAFRAWAEWISWDP